MASVVIAGDVSGTCTLQAANAAGTTVLSLPTTSGTLVSTTTPINASNITSGTLAVSYGGTGANTLTGYVKGSGTSAMTASSTVPTSDLTGTLAIANGGTNSTSTPAAGGAVYGTGSAYAITSAGTTGQALISNGSSAPSWGSSIVSGTAVASTSGTSIDFTGIPSWVKRVTVMFNEMSTNGSSNKLVQIGAGSVATSGYISTGIAQSTGGAGSAASTSGFMIFADNAGAILSGTMVIVNQNGNNWVATYSGKFSTTQLTYGGGSCALGGTLDRVRITTVNGTDAFDAGSINILYE